jgi:glycosyltransferase involved in cell wall biosynthesis
VGGKLIIKDLVSTIIPVYNRPELLAEAVASVLAQTYRPIEILIVDDGSTDDTAKVADRLAKDHPREIRGIHKENSGPGSSREAGRLQARGEFIQYLDSDDILLPRKFELQVAGLRAHPECGVAYGKTRYYERGEIPADIPWKRTGEKIKTMFPAFLESRWWGTSTPLYRREITDRAGAWTSLSREEDWEYDSRIAAFGVKLYFCGEFVSEQRGASSDRLCRKFDPSTWRDRAKAHALIFDHARRAGISEEAPEMRHFARELFWLSRECGAEGLAEEAKELFKLARAASGARRGGGFDFKAYRVLAGIVGWVNAGRLSCLNRTPSGGRR